MTNGQVQAVKTGSSTITAIAQDGSGKKADCVVNVKNVQAENQYKLVWEDNFSGTKLNLNDWNIEYHDPCWVNNELQEYTDSSENTYN